MESEHVFQASQGALVPTGHSCFVLLSFVVIEEREYSNLV